MILQWHLPTTHQKEVQDKLKEYLPVLLVFRIKDYAMILSYIETCYRNGITRYQSLQRLLDDNLYTVKEIKKIITTESEKSDIFTFLSWLKNRTVTIYQQNNSNLLLNIKIYT